MHVTASRLRSRSGQVRQLQRARPHLQTGLGRAIAAQHQNTRDPGCREAPRSFQAPGEHDGHALLEQPTLKATYAGRVVHEEGTLAPASYCKDRRFPPERAMAQTRAAVRTRAAEAPSED